MKYMWSCHVSAFRRAAVWACCLTLLLFTKPSEASDSVSVFAAASLKNALDEIASVWPGAKHTSVVTTYAGSSVLARQIQHGAPADVFISANEAWMNALDEKGQLTSASRFNLISNRLVLVSHSPSAAPFDLSSESNIAEILGNDRLAMALVNAVPAGIYGKAAFESLGLWPSIRDRIAQTDNVRAALALVATGETPLGVVYASDANASDAISIAATFPIDSHPPIRYPAALIRGRETFAAKAFMTFLMSEAAKDILVRHGFSPAT